MAGLGDLIVVVEDLATYEAAVNAGKTAPSVMYLILAERQVYFNSELWSKAPEEGGGGVSQEDFDALYDGVVEAEEVTAAALNDLNDKLGTLSGQVETAVTSEQLSSAVDNVNNTILENEEITAAALVDLNTKITDILERLNNAGL